MGKQYEWKKSTKDKPPVVLPFDLLTLEIVPMAYRDDYIEIKPCSGEHKWVRSIIISGRRTAGHAGTPYYFRVEDSVVWCEMCGSPFIWPGGSKPQPQEFRLPSAGAYYGILNPERDSYQGIDTSWYAEWIPAGQDDVHSDWQMAEFQQAGWVR